MTTFTTNQSLPIPELTDLANGPGAFAALAAAVEPRLFAVYASAVDRSLRNPTPPPGSVSALLDVGRVEYYGSAWVDLWTVLNPLYSETVVTAATTTGVTEAFHASNTFTALAGRRYRVRYTGTYGGATSGSIVAVLLRWKAGSTVDAGGTQMRSVRYGGIVGGPQEPFSIEGTSTSMTPGTVTVGVSCFLSSGLNTVTLDASATNQGLLCVEDVSGS